MLSMRLRPIGEGKKAGEQSPLSLARCLCCCFFSYRRCCFFFFSLNLLHNGRLHSSRLPNTDNAYALSVCRSIDRVHEYSSRHDRVFFAHHSVWISIPETLAVQ